MQWSMEWESLKKLPFLQVRVKVQSIRFSSQGADTLITGELKQHHFNLAQELELNLYACGHYATETFGVDALAREVLTEIRSSLRIC